MAPKKTTKEVQDWLEGAFHGDPADARAHCEKTMSPNYLRFQAGGGRTDFEQAVEKITMFRTITKKWSSPVTFLVQEENRIAVQFKVDMEIGDGGEKQMELMLMATIDDLGRFENVWELTSEIKEDS
jgi:hypothetical protein